MGKLNDNKEAIPNIPTAIKSNNKMTIVVDGVFFQLYKTGIARLWKALLEVWVKDGFAEHIVLVDRGGTAPKIPGIKYRHLKHYNYNTTSVDRELLQQICDEEEANVFISTYYTTPISTPSVFMAYDMIPEVLQRDMNEPMWKEKHFAIRHASFYIAISENTARDLVRFFPDIRPEYITVAYCGVDSTLSPANIGEIEDFKTKYGITKPYFLLVGGRKGNKNAILFFQAFAQLYSKQGFEIVCTSFDPFFEDEFREYTAGCIVHKLQLNDLELRLAYSGAIALVFPSQYEGFGLPVLEALTCGCPVITCPNSSIPEVAGEAALYVKDDDVDAMVNALCDIQKPAVRNFLISAGFGQAKKFSWAEMAQKVRLALINATLFSLKLKNINIIIFPNWLQPEEYLYLDLAAVIRTAATHPDRSMMTLLIDSSDITENAEIEPNLILSSIVMSLLMEEDIDVTDGLEISIIGKLDSIQWEVLLPRIQAKITLENQKEKTGLADIPSCSLDSFPNRRAIQLAKDIWKFE